MNKFYDFLKLWKSALWINFQNLKIIDKPDMDKILKIYP